MLPAPPHSSAGSVSARPLPVDGATLTADLADRFARIALGHVRREYPNHLMHAVDGPEREVTPSRLHPVFYGSYDWHSCVHGYWLLARLRRRYPHLPAAAEIRHLFDTMLVPERIAGECAYFDRPTARGYERPYGWAWLLKLAAELQPDADAAGPGDPDPAWAAALAPLAGRIQARFEAFLPLATYPVRTGTHYNTAFALRLAADHASATGETGFLALLADTAERWYGEDRCCTAWGEPSGDDFLSPSLIEAECCRHLLPKARFAAWFDAFLPALGQAEPAHLLTPAIVSDRSDGKIAHLDGLNLSRSWCLTRLSRALSPDDPRRTVLLDAAARHRAAGLAHVAGDYMGEHWLATYALFALGED